MHYFSYLLQMLFQIHFLLEELLINFTFIKCTLINFSFINYTFINWTFINITFVKCTLINFSFNKCTLMNFLLSTILLSSVHCISSKLIYFNQKSNERTNESINQWIADNVWMYKINSVLNIKNVLPHFKIKVKKYRTYE